MLKEKKMFIKDSKDLIEQFAVQNRHFIPKIL